MGRGTALVMAGEGARVALVARTPATLEKTAAEVAEAGAADVAHFAADFIQPDHVREVVGEVRERFGRIDGLVNTIGACEVVPEFADRTDELWQATVDSVLLAAVRACREVVPIMREQGGGAIVNISAMSVRHYIPRIEHYSAAKAALAHFTKNLAQEFAPDHIRANAVMPGWIASESVLRYLESARSRDLGPEHGGRRRGYFEYGNARGATSRGPTVGARPRRSQRRRLPAVGEGPATSTERGSTSTAVRGSRNPDQYHHWRCGDRARTNLFVGEGHRQIEPSDMRRTR